MSTTSLLPDPVATRPGVLVHSRRDRELAAARWLILSAPRAEDARREWETFGAALLRCGRLFSAVPIAAGLVHAAAGTEDREAVKAFLAEALDGPVYYATVSHQYYALTPASAPRTWRLTAVDCLDSDSYLGVPATDLTEPDPRYPAYWVVPMDGPGALCTPAAVERLVLAGQREAAKAAGEGR
ncbi:hypothetical protein [Streptomyces sp. NPDC058861]|uniref:hypothetical protein n=1 Tax=Streptomyces sp. NPDC058861 TaxID=3346653 RepID=UPI0036B5E789